MMPLRRPVFFRHLSEQCVAMGRGGEVLTSYLPRNVSCDISCPGTTSSQVVARTVLLTVSVSNNFQGRPKLLEESLTRGHW